MRIQLFGFAVLGLLAACSTESAAPGVPASGADPGAVSAASVMASPPRANGIADLPDHGALLGYAGGRGSAAVARGAYTWHPVKLSEEHALAAIAGGELVVTAPDGRAIRLRYERHVEQPDGNWTWVGREPGAQPGTEAIITFGEKAVFGSIPDGDRPPLRLTSASGRTWLVATDPVALARLDSRAAHPRKPDFRLPPRLSLPASAGAPPVAASGVANVSTGAASTLAGTTVDLLIGYTPGFAAGLGGQSAALTRLHHLVEVTNQAYVNSQIEMQVRLVHATEVNYPDNTSNEDALYELTGVECTPQNGGQSCSWVGPAAALQPLHVARDKYGADLVSLVRDFNEPENEGCGLAWINGGGQVEITAGDEITGLSVVGDGMDPVDDGSGGFYYCRDETLAHELGHNMGSAHDRDTADGDDNVLQLNEYGRYPYSFGHKSAAADFYTVMAYGDVGQTAYRVFSNPSITSCGGQPCGVANQADNARSLRQTVPVIAAFRASIQVPEDAHFSGDYNGDGKSDILWYNQATGASTLWRSGDRSTRQVLPTVADRDWRIMVVGDFGGDGKSDLFWRNLTTGANTIWHSANRDTKQVAANVTDVKWQPVGAGDFNGDGKSDILWRNQTTGSNAIWLSGNKATKQAVAALAKVETRVAGIGDFDGDGKDDILWRNGATGANVIWRSANIGSLQIVTTVADLDWRVAGVGDYNGDGRADIFWRNMKTGVNSIWRSANKATQQVPVAVSDTHWQIATSGDFNGDLDADVMWRNYTTGANSIWRSGDRSGYLATAAVTDLNWIVAP